MMKLPSNLSKSKSKSQLYSGDPYFRDTWDDLKTLFDSDASIVEQFQDVSLVILRPDAIVNQRLEKFICIVKDMGLVPFFATSFIYSRHMVREGWRYQLNIATPERIEVMDMILSHAPSILIMFHKTEKTKLDPHLPLTLQLSEMKGPSDPLKRSPSDFRSLLGDAQVSVLTYLHISDEPADVIREMGIFLSKQERLSCLSNLQVKKDYSNEVQLLINDQYKIQPAQSLIESSAYAAINQRSHKINGDDKNHTAVVDAIVELKQRDNTNWKALFSVCEKQNVPITIWEKVAIAGPNSKGHFEQLHPVLPDVSISDWKKDSKG
ncbi:hypothetical protein ACMG4P_24775 [Pseudovibrio denitrificans]|uniref:hypothetical protein n=1 Tax=Pseudovibrio denitrificans TaxID=258256 RepID=UPI0039BFBBD3